MTHPKPTAHARPTPRPQPAQALQKRRMKSKPIILLLSLSPTHVTSFAIRQKTHRTTIMVWTPNSSEQRSLSEELSIAPLDKYNAKLLNEVRPLDYKNPTVQRGTVWDLVVIGAGAGGLVSSRQVRDRC